jgi:hypothetical protein
MWRLSPCPPQVDRLALPDRGAKGAKSGYVTGLCNSLGMNQMRPLSTGFSACTR